VQAIVPLTGAEGNSVPLLLVLDETMFSQCGITEWIECEVMKAALPKIADPNPRKVDCGGTVIDRDHLHELGYDPIVTADNAACSLPNADVETIRLTLEGPFGHTKDMGARQALFANSSFMVHPYKSATWRGRGWDFAKIRFRRTSGDELSDSAPVRDDWTEPVWVQFLPSSGFGLEKDATDSLLRVTLNKASKQVELRSSDPQINPFPDMKLLPMFKYCALLTRKVKDFRGQGEHEVYHDCIRLEFDANATSLTGMFNRPLDPKTTAVLTARLVEVQSVPAKPENLTTPYKFEDLPAVGPGENFDQKFWNALFDINGDESRELENAKYRITRMSLAKDVEII
jgi:hypothetical protein